MPVPDKSLDGTPTGDHRDDAASAVVSHDAFLAWAGRSTMGRHLLRVEERPAIQLQLMEAIHEEYYS